MNELPKIYEPKECEAKWYQQWLDKNYFHSEPNSEKKPFTIMIPPPNVTGMLTMGHVLNNTLQDILIRKARMEGCETLWLPGTDHAGIATQTAVEKSLRKEGKSRHDYEREDFVQLVWDWKEKYGGIIIKQLKKLGVSCDWERERFTLDEGLSAAVREVFVRMYKKGLIYKGKRIINWCPVSLTALSDEEVIYKESYGKLWYFQYPLAENPKIKLVVATTRPETMLGDTAVAVNPNDERYRHLIGKIIDLPIVERKIPIIADDYVDMEFGTGAVKVTPAHDPNDYEMAMRHNLQFINVMNDDATMNENAGADYKDLDRYEARKKIVKAFDALGLLLKIEDYTNKVGYSERADVRIEPRLSEQWFVKMEPLAKPALEVVNNGKIKFHPERWVKTYNHWLENVRDWCISRQLWWGHRIPVFHCESCGWEDALLEDPKSCPQCGNVHIRQDEDVLDTWFSSWLWPFSTLDWPKENEDLKYYYPTNDLVTGPDIIFFWVARMIMAGLEFQNDIPFRNVYFTGIIRDAQGRKMSKSLGNSPDPLDLIDRFGADALRFGVMLIAPQGQDILFDEERIEVGRNFMNKLWNASRFVLMNRESDFAFSDNLPAAENLETADLWILQKMNQAVQSVSKNLDNYRFNDAAKDIYEFTWSAFCDWYIELVKIRFYQGNAAEKATAMTISLTVLRTILKLLHPFAPFITEEIWQMVKMDHEGDIIISPWPHSMEIPAAETESAAMELMMQMITAVRVIRSEMLVPPAKKADVIISGGTANQREIIEKNRRYLESLAKVDKLTIGENMEKAKLSATAVVEGLEIFVPLAGLIDIEKERARLAKEIQLVENRLKATRAKLTNDSFRSKAPEAVVNAEREKERSNMENLKLLQEHLRQLSE
jgi:valyl-tRNA synthetase